MNPVSAHSWVAISRFATIFLLSLGVTITPLATAQHFTREIGQFIGQNARQFLQPMADGLMASLNGGLYTGSRSPSPFIELQGVFVGSIFSSDQRTFPVAAFTKVVEFEQNGVTFLGDFDIPGTSLPTAVGLGRKVTFTGTMRRIRVKGSPYIPGLYPDQSATVNIGGYEDITVLPLFAPQLSFGSVAGTSVVLRFLPRVNFSDIGDATIFGIGLQHDVGRYLPLPLDLSVQVAYQYLNAHGISADLNVSIEESAVALRIHVTKLLGVGVFKAGPFVSLGYETGSLTVEYTFADPTLGNQSVTFDGMSNGRVSLGLATRLTFLFLNAEYNFANVSGFGVSAGIVYDF